MNSGRSRARDDCGERGSELRWQEARGPAWGHELDAALGRRGGDLQEVTSLCQRMTQSVSRARSPAGGTGYTRERVTQAVPALRDIRFPIKLPEPDFLNSLGEFARMNEFPIRRSTQRPAARSS